MDTVQKMYAGGLIFHSSRYQYQSDYHLVLLFSPPDIQSSCQEISSYDRNNVECSVSLNDHHHLSN